jgi:hypothetical protein
MTATDPKMVEKQIQAPIVITMVLLLALSLYIVVNMNNYLDSANNQPFTTPENETLALVSKKICINEFMADNDRAVESVFGGHPDWVELFNTANESIDLGGIYLSDSLSKPTWQFPNGTVILSHSYLIVWADADAGQAPLQTNFNLRANGGVIALFAEDRKILIDFVLYDKQIRDVSYGRIPDGGLSWDYMSIPTAGKANAANPRSNAPAPWEVWLFIIVAILILAVVAFRNKIHLRRKK